MAVEDLDVWIQLRTDPATGCDGCRNSAAHGWRCALQQLSIQQCIIHWCYNLFILVLFSQMGPFFQGKMSTLLGTITYHPPFFAGTLKVDDDFPKLPLSGGICELIFPL